MPASIRGSWPRWPVASTDRIPALRWGKMGPGETFRSPISKARRAHRTRSQCEWTALVAADHSRIANKSVPVRRASATGRAKPDLKEREARGGPKSLDRIVGAQTCCAHFGGRDKFAPLRMPRRKAVQPTFRTASASTPRRSRARASWSQQYHPWPGWRCRASGGRRDRHERGRLRR